MKTTKLYYSHPKLFATEAAVLNEVKDSDSWLLECDSTIFYPEGGGQPCDLGSIAGIPVIDVQETKDGSILHRIERATGMPLLSRVSMEVDQARRLDHCQQHSAQHLVSALFLEVCNARTLSFHLGRVSSFIDVDVWPLSPSAVAQVEGRALSAICAAVTIRSYVCPPDDISALKLRKPAPVGKDEVRLIEIEGIDCTPCCGTHLSATGEIMALRLLKAEKYKGGARVSFVAGARALRDYSALAADVTGLASLMGVAEDRVVETVTELAQSKLQLRQKNLELVRMLWQSELEHARAGNNTGLLRASYVDREAAMLEEGIKILAPHMCAVVLSSTPDLVAFVASKLPVALAKELLARHGGKGGGASIFRAAFQAQSSLEGFVDDITKALQESLAGEP